METQGNKIEPQSSKFPQAIIWIAGIALTLFCAAGIAAFMGWIPNSIGGPSDKVAVGQPSANTVPPAAPEAQMAATSLPPPVAPTAPVQEAAVATCAQCGVIESVREVDAKGQG